MKNKQEIINEKKHDFDSLRSVMALLRGKGGCPWDREQTHASIRKCLIEETYEVVEAIDTEDAALLREELGDLLFQAVFHARIEEEKGSFTIEDVVHDITAKMIHRHPHVLGAGDAKNSDQVLQKWEEIKSQEKQIESVAQSLRRVPPYLPALLRAQKIQGKARKKLAFGYTSCEDALAAAVSAKGADLASELAEKVFALCAAAEMEGIDLEAALSHRCDAFIDSVETFEQSLTV